MAEAKVLVDNNKKIKKLIEVKGWWKMKWAIIGAVVVLMVAVSLTVKHDRDHKSCHCSQDSRKYTGIVGDCCCDYETMDTINEAVLHPLLQELVKTSFFRYFKVKLWCECPFWPDDGMCELRDCSVCECPEDEFPEPFKKAMLYGLPSDDLKCQEGNQQDVVDRTLDSKAFTGWIEADNPWTHDDETDNREMTYVNLQLNPERYTGYTGASARRIWVAIYSENCPKYTSGEICPEKRVLYKLISGLHSSISIHVASDCLLDETKNLWGSNLELMYDRVFRFPDHVRNLYFTFMFVLRAVEKEATYLEQAEYDTGNLEEDLKAHSLMRQLVYNPKLQAACPLPFDEAKLWQGQSGPELKLEIQKNFKNISALMDCVGCEKCRLWGKLQVLGLGTALKILFSVDGKNQQNQPLQLQRNEVIALVNLLHRLSESVKLVQDIGPSVEQTMEGFRSSPPQQETRVWQRIRQAVCINQSSLADTLIPFFKALKRTL
ncbi:endoplasmic reticulum oxidoreductin-1-like isoform X2 [Primulina huaijiensis]|uniref:endoplasmic reticulum oxidoreductin-1-like isoform X2 n=1 Tax=Primulina huaijiensis TaxID=1492673 RepID=UPI003CC7993E